MALPTTEQLACCIKQLTRFIPNPKKTKVRLQASKWGLKVGQLLRSPSNEIFTVGGIDSQGIILETPDGKICRLEKKEELSHYEKVRRTKKRTSL